MNNAPSGTAARGLRQLLTAFVAAILLLSAAVLTAGTASAQAPDSDGDRIEDAQDNCPNVRNRGQRDLDNDGIGNKCDDDIDGDDVPNELDARPRNPNVGIDTDGDRINDDVDNCPNVRNRGQRDNDNDGYGNKCDEDRNDPNVAVAAVMEEMAPVDVCDPVNEPGQICLHLIDVGDVYGEFIEVDLDQFVPLAPATCGLNVMCMQQPGDLQAIELQPVEIQTIELQPITAIGADVASCNAPLGCYSLSAGPTLTANLNSMEPVTTESFVYEPGLFETPIVELP